MYAICKKKHGCNGSVQHTYIVYKRILAYIYGNLTYRTGHIYFTLGVNNVKDPEHQENIQDHPVSRSHEEKKLIFTNHTTMYLT